MQAQINDPITAHPLYEKTREIFLFAQELNLAGVRPKDKSKSIAAQHGLTVRGARQMIKLAKPKKHRSRN